MERLERVLWRLRRSLPGRQRFTWKELRKAIIYECGTDDRTYYNNVKALRTLGWIRSAKGHKNKLILTDKDLEEGL